MPPLAHSAHAGEPNPVPRITLGYRLERMASATVAPGLYETSLHQLASHFDGGASSLHPAAGPPPFRMP